jgi:hypothetical protein
LGKKKKKKRKKRKKRKKKTKKKRRKKKKRKKKKITWVCCNKWEEKQNDSRPYEIDVEGNLHIYLPTRPKTLQHALYTHGTED